MRNQQLTSQEKDTIVCFLVRCKGHQAILLIDYCLSLLSEYWRGVLFRRCPDADVESVALDGGRGYDGVKGGGTFVTGSFFRLLFIFVVCGPGQWDGHGGECMESGVREQGRDAGSRPRMKQQVKLTLLICGF